MKILVLYRYSQGNSYNHFCNVDFYQYLNNISNVQVKYYGPDVHQLFPDLTLVHFNKGYTFKQLYKKYNFDVLIVAGKNRTYYQPKEIESWLPIDFEAFNCLKILIEPDYHKYRKDNWFNSFNVILHRHKSNVIRAIEDFPYQDHIWFPFSVDTSVFHPIKNEKINKVCFVGNHKSNSYCFRKRASSILLNENLLDFHDKKYENEYIEILNKYSVYLSGSSNFTIDCAKAFEIIASGSILLTNDVDNGFKELFGKCFIVYKNDFSDLIEKTKYLLENKGLQKKLINKGLSSIKKHTHQKRCKQLVDIINNTKFKDNTIENKEMDIVYVIGNMTDDSFERFKKSYESIRLNENYNIKISEVGTDSSYDKLKEFIVSFDYHFEERESFDASIAKNNSFKYLIKNELFSFMDVDMIVPEDFVKKALKYYSIYKKAFICSYVRFKECQYDNYSDMNKNIDIYGENKITDCGVLVCDRIIYEELNGFDEEYVGWGGRDSDFYKRAECAGKFLKCTTITLFHQHHERNFGENKVDNKIRYRRRFNSYIKNPELIPTIKGLVDKRIDESTKFNQPLVRSVKTDIECLINNGIDVCLLNKTCLQKAKGSLITYPLYLGVSDIEKAKSFVADKVVFLDMPVHTKKVKYDNFDVKVPRPIVDYLRKLYGFNWRS